VPTRSQQEAPVPKSQDWRNLQFSEPLKPERQHQQRKWRQKRPQEAPAAVESSQNSPVPTGSPPKPPLPLAPRIPKGALVNSGTSQGSLVPSVSPKLGESLRIPKQPWQKQREQNIPKGASVSPFHLLILLIFRFITKKQKTLTSNMLLN